MKNIKADFKTVATSEWEIGAIYAYDIIHNGSQDLTHYRHHTKESLIKQLSRFTLSNNGKNPMTSNAMRCMPVEQLKRILAALNRSNNLGDITGIRASDLPDSDILTYSFPCQDLSIAGYWHHNTGGIDPDADNRSSLLWQISRILGEYQEIQRDLPRFLLMENVSEILSKKNIGNFRKWCDVLEDMGYVNQVYTLDARGFGVPQMRVRTYMLSVLAENFSEKEKVRKYFDENNLQEKQEGAVFKTSLDGYLKLDYSNRDYMEEAICSTPNYTMSREKIYNDNLKLAEDGRILENCARTVTTKQDRNPNSGIVAYRNNQLTSWNHHYRNLTPRECFLLMGFDEEDFNALKRNNFSVRKGGRMLSDAKLIRLAGNSIVVPVLEALFRQVEDLNELIG